MNGKTLLSIVLSHIATNGYWLVYIRNVEDDLFLALPVAATVGLLAILIFHCLENWDK